MGIKGLNDIIKKYCPNILKNEIKLSEYTYKKIAIDTTLYMFKYKAILGDKWLNGFLNLIICLRKNNIHCVIRICLLDLSRSEVFKTISNKKNLTR